MTTTHQVFETSSSSVIEKNQEYFYENDTIKISYDLWSSNGGTLKFQIYNKTEKPIYIDWEHSNFIWNSYSIGKILKLQKS